ncbi:MAG: hypothetical protein ISS50_04395 [Anaerolineae bacterium]|nr:hypothetical protein [Anaerolineae bacterium]
MRARKTRFCLLGALIALVLWAIGDVGIMHADGPQRVGLVVDFGDGRVETTCVAFEEAEITGMDVLLRARYEVVTGFGGGAVCQINGQGCPSSNCLGCHPADDGGWIYWAYFHLEDGHWSYSQLGVAAYYVSDGDVEGWAWGTGQADLPPIITFDEICASPTETPTNTPISTSTPTSTATPTPQRPTETPMSTPTPTSAPTSTSTPAPQRPTEPPTSTPTPASVPTFTVTPVPEKPTETPTGTPTSTSTPTPSPTSTATPTPGRPTGTPTSSATPSPVTVTGTATLTATPQPSATAEVQAEGTGQNPTIANVKLVERSSTPGEANRLFKYAIFSIMVIGLLAAIILFRMR